MPDLTITAENFSAVTVLLGRGDSAFGKLEFLP
jgi:hypothetical protein